MPKEREGTDVIGGAVLMSPHSVVRLKRTMMRRTRRGFTEACGPIAAGLCPEILAACRRGCRPEHGTPPPPSTRSA